MKILQINSVCGFGSTGRIVTDIADLLMQQGHECRIAYGRGTVPDQYQSIAVRIGNDIGVKLHGLRTRLLDQHGFGSKRATKAFLKWVDEYDPDLIHLHNIHGYYIHIGFLFEYLKKSKKPVVWTLHDCWAMTGHCAHFSAAGCEQWRDGCRKCSLLRDYPATILGGCVKQNYTKKKKLFTNVPKMTVVTPSYWLASIVKQSFLGEYSVQPIYNGLDLDVFKPTKSDFREKYGLENKKIILGVANVWGPSKGLGDFEKLSNMISDEWKIILVGLSEQQIRSLPESIIRLPRTKNIEELVQIYTAADVYVNASVEETMGLTTAEALACGTPVITYNKTAVPEVADSTCGICVETQPEEILNALGRVHFSEEACISRASRYEKKKQYHEYIELYKKVFSRS